MVRIKPSTLATIVADFGHCCGIRRQYPFSATVAEFGDKLSPFPACLVAEFGVDRALRE